MAYKPAKRPTTPDEANKASLFNLRRHYISILEELAECKRQRKAMESVAQTQRKSATDAKATVRQQSKQLLTISRQQKAQEEMKKAGAWSGGAAIFVIILYQVFHVLGFPGGNQWENFWNHEAVYGVCMCSMTYFTGWVYKALHPNARD
jgi:hypothetical protein|tara:strand:+ start:863 stop:1309 length:447 start_codon:yes stop_codon:yes gene_type:complete